MNLQTSKDKIEEYILRVKKEISTLDKLQYRVDGPQVFELKIININNILKNIIDINDINDKLKTNILKLKNEFLTIDKLKYIVNKLKDFELKIININDILNETIHINNLYTVDENKFLFFEFIDNFIFCESFYDNFKRYNFKLIPIEFDNYKQLFRDSCCTLDRYNKLFYFIEKLEILLEDKHSYEKNDYNLKVKRKFSVLELIPTNEDGELIYCGLVSKDIKTNDIENKNISLKLDINDKMYNKDFEINYKYLEFKYKCLKSKYDELDDNTDKDDILLLLNNFNKYVNDVIKITFLKLLFLGESEIIKYAKPGSYYYPNKKGDSKNMSFIKTTHYPGSFPQVLIRVPIPSFLLNAGLISINKMSNVTLRFEDCYSIKTFHNLMRDTFGTDMEVKFKGIKNVIIS